MSTLPSRLLIDADGYVWRDYGTHLSMAPSNPDNEPLAEPIHAYVPAWLNDDMGEVLAAARAVVRPSSGLAELEALEAAVARAGEGT